MITIVKQTYEVSIEKGDYEEWQHTIKHVFEIQRDGIVLFECALYANAQLAKVEIERLEAQVSELESKLDECQQNYDDC